MRRLLFLAALPLAAQQSGLDIQAGNASDARIVQLLDARQWGALADHFETLSPKDRARNQSTWLQALQKASRWQRLLEATEGPVSAEGPQTAPSPARQYRAQAFLRLGRFHEAAQAYLDLGRRGDPKGFFNAIAAAEGTEDTALHLQTAESVLALQPALPEAKALRGEALAKLLRTAEAEPLLLEAVTLLPNRAMAWARLATCRQMRAALPEALEAADKAVALDPKLVEGHYTRARALMGLQRYPEAREALATALSLGPSPDTRASLEPILEQVDRYLEGQKRKAEREAEKAAALAARKKTRKK